MAAVEQPEKIDENSTQNEEHDNVKPISGSVSSTNLLSVSASSNVHRLVVVSSKIRHPSALETAALNGVTILIYQQDGEELDSLLLKIKEACTRTKPVSIAFLAHGHPGSMVLCSGRGEKVLSKPSLAEDEDIRNFFKEVATFIDRSDSSARLDFLNCPVLLSTDWKEVVEELEAIVEGLNINMTKDIMGPEISGKKQSSSEHGTSCEPGDLYFQSEKLRKWSGATPRSISNFERIKIVGKGSYGAAVLYRKKDDDSLVILKEINMHDLTAQERQLATNEAKIMSKLNHPNIINCYDSFEEDGTIWIEMEYADGGTLAQYLTKLDREMEEKEILKMFYEMALALQCIHQHKILHRDMKTQNIFLTLEGHVKLGDFGISKQLGNTKSNANTVLGTPYYISPEICEGRDYNEKSDIWSLGCVLYEMANKQKTFESTNLPALVNKIVKGQFAPIRGNYSQDFKALVRDCLQIEPQYRPDASELVSRVHELLCQFDMCDEESLKSALNPKRKEKRRSILYYVDLGSMSGVVPINLPVKILITDVSVGRNHVCVVSSDSRVFTWGDNSKGQLGHGDLVARDQPTEVEGVKGKNVVTACSGDRFTVLLTDNGIVMSFGDGDYGCMGHGDWSSVSRPKLVEGLLAVDTGSLSCGPHHVSAVCDDGSVYTWGCGADGRLGQGDEDSRKIPTKVEFGDKVMITKAQCGMDGTMFLTDTGTLYACGKNTNNKLGLNNRQGFLVQMKNLLTKVQVEGRTTPTALKILARHSVVDMSLGPTHSSVLMESGNLYTFGDNRHGQLGHGNVKTVESPACVKSLVDKRVTMMKCGDLFTLTGTDEDTIYFWGSMPYVHVDCDEVGPRSDEAFEKKHRRNASSSLSSGASESTVSSPRPSSGKCDYSRTRPSSGLDHDYVGSRRKDTLSESTNANLSVDGKPSSASGDRPKSGFWRNQGNYLRDCVSRSNLSHCRIAGCLRVNDCDPISVPTLLFQWDAICGPSEKDGDYPVFLKRISGYAENTFVQIDTTAPAPRKKSKRRSTKREEGPMKTVAERRTSSEISLRQQQSKNGLDDSGTSLRRHTDSSTADQSSSSEMDTIGDAPTWLKDELKDGIKKDKNFDVDDGISSVDESAGSDLEEEVFIKPKKDLATKKPGISQGKPYTKYRTKTKGGAETKNVGGVTLETPADDAAVLPGQVPADGAQSTQSRQPRRKRTKVQLNCDVFYQPGVPRTKHSGVTASLRAPVGSEKLRPASVTSESGVEMTPTEQHGSMESRMKQNNGMAKSVSKRGLSPNAPGKPRGTPNSIKAWGNPAPPPSIESRQRPATRTSSTNGSIPAKRRVGPREDIKTTKMPAIVIPSQTGRKDSRDKKELTPIKPMPKFPKPGIHTNGCVSDSHVDYNEQLKEAKVREKGLVDEIQVLKNELLKQSSQLQENFHIVISLQEQVARLQEEQLKQQAKEKRQNITNQRSDINQSLRRSSLKSTVCAIM
ncbi:uncharacterized protein LOC114525324 [Dendronephthya gigantea]|uniref:uncharacterized protein LOC114525324 n=1 Tax=Dendronephthya gigantea TaxID=151771 RepID=UPI00106AC702|nr:uncharacterized protein LOC114525324 [Dendronephthya gigantea]